MIRYFDSCALVKRYIRERGSEDVGRLIAESTPATARLSVIEIISALSRRCREGDLDTTNRDLAIRALNDDMSRTYVIELSKSVCDLAGRLLTQHTLRAGDAIQLASCLHLKKRTGSPVPLITYNARLIEAAHAEDIETRQA